MADSIAFGARRLDGALAVLESGAIATGSTIHLAVRSLTQSGVKPPHSKSSEREIELLLMNRRVARDIDRAEVVLDLIQYVALLVTQRACDFRIHS